MIYEPVEIGEPICQGDIFQNVPRVDFTLSDLAVIDEYNEPRAMSWQDLLATKATEPISAIFSVKPVTAIVITQNCDAVRGQSLSLCQIDNYLAAMNQAQPPKDAKGWQSLLMKNGRTNSRFFYLPESQQFSLPDKMAVDFRLVLPVPRTDLESLRHHRVARLNRVANEHFRESLGNFFRRYAYNEWYALSPEELRHYPDPGAAPYEWQK